MNKVYILYNLKEAKEQLDSIIKDLEEDTSYEIGTYSSDMQHLYHHINTAWNSRESTEEESNICTEQDFYKWREFPNNIYLGM